VRSAAGAAAALAAGAVALVAGVVPGAGHHGNEGEAVDTAYVVKRIDRALSAAGPGDIAHMTVTTSGGTTATTAEEWSYGNQWRSVTNSPSGHPIYDQGLSSSSVYTQVSYQRRIWARQPEPASPDKPLSGCELAVAAPLLLFQLGVAGGASASSLPATVAGDLRTAISCGTLAVAGRQRVDGTEAIELTSRPGSQWPETIWVSPDTYLPVRVVARPAPRKPGAAWQTADITWLPPTTQNLATLTVPVPAGFRQVPAGLFATKSR